MARREKTTKAEQSKETVVVPSLAEILDKVLPPEKAREMCRQFLDGKNEATGWKAFKRVAAYKRGSPDQRKFFGTVLSDEKESEMWGRFLQSKSQTVAREALRLAKRYGVPARN